MRRKPKTMAQQIAENERLISEARHLVGVMTKLIREMKKAIDEFVAEDYE